MMALRRLVSEIMTPTDGSPYVWAVIALGHVMLGVGIWVTRFEVLRQWQ